MVWDSWKKNYDWESKGQVQILENRNYLLYSILSILLIISTYFRVYIRFFWQGPFFWNWQFFPNFGAPQCVWVRPWLIYLFTNLYLTHIEEWINWSWLCSRVMKNINSVTWLMFWSVYLSIYIENRHFLFFYFLNILWKTSIL